VFGGRLSSRLPTRSRVWLHSIIGGRSRELSATIEVIDRREQILGSRRFTTDKAGYRAILDYV
jgi:hypothetical protein